MITFNLADTEDGSKIEVDKVGATYSIKVVETASNQRNIVLEDTQRKPFWGNIEKKAAFFKEVKAKTPALTTEKWDFICTELSAADEEGDIGAEKEPTMGGVKITDKRITDLIMDKHLFYCGKADVNQTLYLFAGDHWSNGAAESVILNELSDIFKNEERRTGMALERTTNFIKGQAMNREAEPKPVELIPFKNGMYDLTTGELAQHDAKYFYTNVIPHDFDPNARCPNWMKWASEVIKLEDMKFLQEWMGYNLYASYPEACFVILIGVGQNAKSCFSALFKKLIGEKNVTDISLADLTYDDFSPAQLEHKLANISDDIGTTIIKNTSRLKKASAGSGITVAKKFQQEHDITPYAKLTYLCNEAPEIKDDSEAIKLRLKVIEFPYIFTKKPEKGQKQARGRKEVDKELEKEIPGIINWALEGLKRFLGNNSTFSATKSTEETWQFYKRNSNPVLCFTEEGLKFTDDVNHEIFKEEMWKGFHAWTLGHKIKRKITRDKFFRMMKELEIIPTRPREHGRAQVYKGVVFVQTSIENPVPATQEKEKEIREEKEKSGERRGKEKFGRLDSSPPLEHWKIPTESEDTTQHLTARVLSYYKIKLPEAKMAEELGVPLGRLEVVLAKLAETGKVIRKDGMVEVL